MTSYIGIDQSLTGTAICAIDDKLNIISKKLIKTKLFGIERLDFICENLLSFIDSISGELVISREEFSFSSKGRSIFDLGALGGCVDLTVYKKSLSSNRILSYYKIPPTVHKKFCIQNGSAVKGSNKTEKKIYLDLIKQHTGESFDDDNIADSYMLARTVMAISTIETDKELYSKLSKLSKEALIPSKFMKDNGLTAGKLSKISENEFVSIVTSSTTKTYRVFDHARLEKNN